jgi:hypothetical protein
MTDDDPIRQNCCARRNDDLALQPDPKLCGFLRDGVPYLWDEASQCWRPVTEIAKYAARWAELHGRG